MKIDLNKERSSIEWKNLLDSIKVNSDNILTPDEQRYFIPEIEYRITGVRHSRDDIRADIEAGMSDISDLKDH